MIEIPVPIHVSKTYRKPEKLAALSKIVDSLKIAQRLAAKIRARVISEALIQERIDGKKRRKPYSKKGRYQVNRRYSKKAGTGDGQKTWKSSEEFHRAAGARAGSAKVTGGMWAGLYARNVGGRSAAIGFRGKSEGRRVKWSKSWQEIHDAKKKMLQEAYARKRLKSGKLSKPARRQIYRATSKAFASRYEVENLVPNRLKAISLFHSLKLNPLMPTSDEIEAISESICLATLLTLEEIFDDGTFRSTPKSKDRKLLAVLAKDLTKTKVRGTAAARELLS